MKSLNGSSFDFRTRNERASAANRITNGFCFSFPRSGERILRGISAQLIYWDMR